MNGTDMIMDQLKVITEHLECIDARLENVDARLENVDARLEKMDERFDRMDERMDKMDARMDNMEGSIQSLRTELIQRMDDMETALDTEINKVYLMAVKNAEDIQLLLPYKDKIINVSSTVEKVQKLEEHQRVTDEVVASHSEAIREFKLIKK